MSTAAPLQKAAAKRPQVATAGPLQSASTSVFQQRKCACGTGTSSIGGECEECRKKKMVGLQTKLRVNEPGDAYEQEADRVAEQVLAKPTHACVGRTPLRIQRFSGPSNGHVHAAPASVERVLAGPGRPLDPALRQDMEHRFGHDFSRVRVHLGAAAEESARDVNANAYTVAHNVVFGEGRFSPRTPEGRRLIAHELAHVVQQGASSISPAGTNVVQRDAPGRRDDRTTVVALKWVRDTDRADFVDRLVGLLLRTKAFRGIPRDDIRASLMVPGGKFFDQYQVAFKTGQQVQLRVTAWYRDDWLHIDVEVVEQPTPAGAQQKSQSGEPPTGQATKKTGSDPAASETAQPIPANETVEQRLARQRGVVADQLARFVVESDRLGYAGASLTVHHSGTGLGLSVSKKGEDGPRPAGASLISFAEARRIIDDEIDVLITMIGPGDAEIEFGRDERGVMTLMRWTNIKEAERRSTAPRTAEDERRAREAEKAELRRYDIPDRAQIYGDIFKKAEEELKDAGIMLVTFTLKELVLWVAGGLVLRALGLFAGALARGLVKGAEKFPYLSRVVSLGRHGDMARAVEALGEAEAKEFTTLMNSLEKNALNDAGVTRLYELTAKVEANIAARVPGLRVIGRMKEHNRLVKAAENLGEAMQREADDLIERYLAGNTNPGIGTKHLSGDIFYLRGRNGARVFYRENAEGYMEILAKTDKNDEEGVIRAVEEYFGK